MLPWHSEQLMKKKMSKDKDIHLSKAFSLLTNSIKLRSSIVSQQSLTKVKHFEIQDCFQTNLQLVYSRVSELKKDFKIAAFSKLC